MEVREFIEMMKVEKFVKEVCSKCEYKEVCDEYEFRFGVRLARKASDGVIRCPFVVEVVE